MLDLIHQITLNKAYWADVHFPNVLLDHQFTGGSFSNTTGETEHSKRISLAKICKCNAWINRLQKTTFWSNRIGNIKAIKHIQSSEILFPNICIVSAIEQSIPLLPIKTNACCPFFFLLLSFFLLTLVVFLVASCPK